jgi:salicylate hydroxylase
MSDASQPHILIAGAGIGGLTVALALARIGARVEVFEQSKELGEVGAGLQLSPNALHALDALGLKDKIFQKAFEPEAASFRDFKSGKPELTTQFKPDFEQRYGQKYLHIHRADLHQILQDAAVEAGVHINLDLPVTGYAQSESEITLNSGDKSFAGDVLIGADGIHSAVRETMLGAEEPSFTGQVAWRGTIAADKIPDGLIPPHANAWLGPGRHFVAYYVRGGALINFVAVEERSGWAEESWNMKGDVSELRTAFAGWDPRITTLLAACEDCFLWGLFDREPLDKWVEGRVALLGDACHPMLPFMAQGAAMAIEDAFVLAKTVSTSSSIEPALLAYENIRKPRASMVQAISRENANLFHLRSPVSRLKRKIMFKTAGLVPAAAYSRLDPVYGVDVTK